MGGDYGPPVCVPAAVHALKRFDDLHLTLVGTESRIVSLLPAEYSKSFSNRLSVHACTADYNQKNHPADVVRHGSDTSVYQSVQLHAEGNVQGVVSASDTGALVALGCVMLKTFPGVSRPAICAQIPREKRPLFLLDVGANVDTHAELLLQFARMGKELARISAGMNDPVVTLLNIGVEPNKGNDQVKMASHLFERQSDFRYEGFVEASDLFDTEADVVVCDGFAGNVALKAMEGTARHIQKKWGDTLMQGSGKLFSRLMGRRLKAFENDIDPGCYNGASLLGLNGVVVKSHGASDVHVFGRAIEQAYSEVGSGLTDKIRQQISISS